MPSKKRWFVAGVAVTLTFSSLSLGGCASGPTLKGTLIGALSGAALGAGTGVLISDDKLLGSTPESKLRVESGQAIGAGVLIGTAFGAIVGAMIGHGQEDKVKALAPETPPAETSDAKAAAQRLRPGVF